MRVIPQSVAQARRESQAKSLLQAWLFLTDPWPKAEPAAAAEQLLAGLSEQGRLWALAAGPQWEWLAVTTPMEFDTRLFGVPVARLWPLAHRRPWPEPESLAQGRRLLRELVAAEWGAGVQCLMARVPARDFAAAQVLEAVGARLVDVSVEWLHELDHLPAAPPPPAGYELRAWRPEEAEALQELAAEAFCDLAAYADRFAVDPRLRAHCPQMYRRWVANSLSGEQADQVLVLAQDDEVAGFITLKLPPGGQGPEADCGWVVMNAIAPAHRGRGLYHRLLLRGLTWLRRHGARRARVRTKISQQAVIRAWAALGARQVYADLTFHLWQEPASQGSRP